MITRQSLLTLEWEIIDLPNLEVKLDFRCQHQQLVIGTDSCWLWSRLAGPPRWGQPSGLDGVPPSVLSCPLLPDGMCCAPLRVVLFTVPACTREHWPCIRPPCRY